LPLRVLGNVFNYSWSSRAAIKDGNIKSTSSDIQFAAHESFHERAFLSPRLESSKSWKATSDDGKQTFLQRQTFSVPFAARLEEHRKIHAVAFSKL